MTAPPEGTVQPGSAQVVVVKVGSSSLTDEQGLLDHSTFARVAKQIAVLRSTTQRRVVLVTSGAVAAGIGALGIARPNDVLTKQALSAVGQSRLMRVWDDEFAGLGLISGQVLLTPNDFFDRLQYLHARRTLIRLLDLGVVPVVNENDAIADDELRFGDNDRIAALVAHMLAADVLVLLTDTAGLFTADPRTNHAAELIAEVDTVTPEIEALAGVSGSNRGSGGMASKLRAAKIASWSGVRAVIASARRDDALIHAVEGRPGCGTSVKAQANGLSARKLWIAFALEADGRVEVDAGAKEALVQRGTSLLPAGVTVVAGDFVEQNALDIAGPDGRVFARGLARYDSSKARARVGQRGAEVLVHRDDLVLLP